MVGLILNTNLWWLEACYLRKFPRLSILGFLLWQVRVCRTDTFSVIQVNKILKVAKSLFPSGARRLCFQLSVCAGSLSYCLYIYYICMHTDGWIDTVFISLQTKRELKYFSEPCPQKNVLLPLFPWYINTTCTAHTTLYYGLHCLFLYMEANSEAQHSYTY